MINSTTTTTTTTTTLQCRRCGKKIKFDDKRVSQRTGKKIPLDVDTDKPHNCTYHQYQLEQQQSPQRGRRYLQCSKNCGSEIHFDVNTKTQSGKWIPLDK